MKSYTERPRTLCSLNGAIDVVGNIYRAIPILHAGPGCSMQAANNTNLYYLGGYHGLPSSNTYEREVVFGGAERLRETIKGSTEVMDGDLYVVLTGCTMGITGDDVEGVINEFKDCKYPLISVDTAGFKGDTYYGYQVTLLAIIKKLAHKTKTDPNMVNLYGQLPSTDITFRGDLEELKRIFDKLGVKLNSFFINHDGIAQLKQSGNSALNINVSPWMCKNIDKYYEVQFGIPTLNYPGMPIGPTATFDFIRQVANELKLDKELVEKVIEEEEQYIYDYFDSFFGTFERYRYILVGESNVVLGLARFLTNDYGHIPLVVVVTDNVPDTARDKVEAEIKKLECSRKADVYFTNDVYKIESIAEKYKDKATLIMGSTFEKKIAKNLDIFFVTATAPCLDHEIINKSHIGIRGCLSMIEDMYNHY